MKNDTGFSGLIKIKLSLVNAEEVDEAARMFLEEVALLVREIMDLHRPHETNLIKEIILMILATNHKIISTIKQL